MSYKVVALYDSTFNIYFRVENTCTTQHYVNTISFYNPSSRILRTSQFLPALTYFTARSNPSLVEGLLPNPFRMTNQLLIAIEKHP